MYDFGSWSECDSEGLRNRVRTLTGGPTTCARTKTVRKKCASKTGKGEKIPGVKKLFENCLNPVMLAKLATSRIKVKSNLS